MAMSIDQIETKSSGDSSVTSYRKSDESTTSVYASFSCELCKEKFNSREELKQHTIQRHKDHR